MSSQATEAEFLSILHWLEHRTGLRFRSDQCTSTVATLARLMTQLEIDDPSTFKRALIERPTVMDRLVNELTVGETYFFREPRQFHFIRKSILPEVIERRGIDHTVRAWSAGCASGEEPYSLAIVCHQLRLARFHILATDIAAASLDKARQATFRQWSFRGDAMATVEPFVVRSGDQYRLQDYIRQQVTFRTLNLAEQVYPSPATGTCDLDLILCRNVLIYFSETTVKTIAKRLHDCLADGGWLLTASGDPPLNELADFVSVITEYGVFYRKRWKSDERDDRKRADVDVVYLPLRRDARVPRSSAEEASGRHETSLPAESVRRDASGKIDRSSASGPKQGTDPPIVSDANANRASQAALDSGDFHRAMALTANSLDDVTACLIHIKATAAIDPASALKKCDSAVQRHELAEELHYLHGVLLEDAHRSKEALQSVQKALFLNSSSVMAHFLFGSIQCQRGQLESARRHFRNVRSLCTARESTEILPLSNGETVGEIDLAAESQLARIDAMAKRS